MPHNMIRSLVDVARMALNRSTASGPALFRPPTPAPQFCLCGIDLSAAPSGGNGSGFESLFGALWLAVPKSKVSKGKKRKKTTVQNRIQKKANIVTDARTGETTLMHKLPFNWKAYLPEKNSSSE